MECDFGQYGTLQDVINTYLKKGQRMDEPLCIFYTIEMLHMLEDLHKVGLIHGDFKPDNLLIRSSSAQLGFWGPDKPGAWQQQGVSLIDWGRSIDLSLFAEGVEFVGDSKTDGFRCTEMIEKKPWVFQVDTYGLCGVVHCLLHGNYMEIDKRPTNGTSQVINRPKAPYKRYWNVNLWQNFFETLLNLNTAKSYDTLHSLRRSFEDYLRSDSGLTKKLRDLMVKQNTMLQSRK
jgi:checkpoint serine/threonine-protein kinase